ncbi:asialoglycoprotein receptor 2-like [Patiria miniata]|uniref:C-type lectin domain-containing protein n=1 Tax=Patiria miniata TaxID=46514 RepID=A0A914A4L6_PATMI|nr:asialoglycoprotein receptor 2-like [Patiria miniata]
MHRRFIVGLIILHLMMGCTDANEAFKASIGRKWACPPPWILWGGNCYRAVMEDLTWLQAKEKCTKEGGFLAVPRSLEETDFFLRLLPYRFWINCNDFDNEGTWKCEDGTNGVEFRNWAAEEPNDNHGNEDCAEVYTGKWNDGTWNDQPCNVIRRAICKAATSPRCTF